MSSSATVLCLGVAIAMIWLGRGILSWIAFLPLAIVCGGVLFTIRGYTVAPDAILIPRLFWKTRLPLAGLQSAQFEPDAKRPCARRVAVILASGCVARRSQIHGGYAPFSRLSRSQTCRNRVYPIPRSGQ
jgi:hypothetical protein